MSVAIKSEDATIEERKEVNLDPWILEHYVKNGNSVWLDGWSAGYRAAILSLEKSSDQENVP